MEIIAKTKYQRASAQKIRLVARSLKKNFSAVQSLIYLNSIPQKGGLLLAKTIKQGIGNATANFNQKAEDLKIKQINIDEGPFLKRFTPVSRGMGHSILKRMSHITVILEGPDGK